MAAMSLSIVHLYPKEMNIYGDTGNRLTLSKRAQWRGIDVQVKLVGVGDPIPGEADIIIGGGGQDAGQGKIQDVLQSKAEQLHEHNQRAIAEWLAQDKTVIEGEVFHVAH